MGSSVLNIVIVLGFTGWIQYARITRGQVLSIRETEFVVAAKAIDMRRQGFFGAAMLPMSELEYTGITEKLATLETRFRVR